MTGSIEPKCHAGPQEQEASLDTLAISSRDSRATELANLQAYMCVTCKARLWVFSRVRAQRRGEEVAGAIVMTKDNGTGWFLPLHKRKSA